MANGEHQELVNRIGQVASDIGEVKVKVAEVNGKIDALTTRTTDNWTNVLERISFSERAAQQAATSLNDRINAEVKRSDERHHDLQKEIDDEATRLDLRIDNIVRDEISPLKTEAQTNAAWRNKVIGWAAGASFVAGIAGGLLVKFMV